MISTKHQNATYWIGKESVGRPSDIVPSMGTLSFQAINFLVCLDYEIDIFGEMYADNVDPKLLVSEKHIQFHTGNEQIDVQF